MKRIEKNKKGGVNTMEKSAYNIIVLILDQLLKLVTPHIKELLKSVLLDVYKRAKETENPIDNILLEALFVILGIEIPSE